MVNGTEAGLALGHQPQAVIGHLLVHNGLRPLPADQAGAVSLAVQRMEIDHHLQTWDRPCINVYTTVRLSGTPLCTSLHNAHVLTVSETCLQKAGQAARVRSTQPGDIRNHCGWPCR